MSRVWLVFISVVLLLASGQPFAAKPQREPAAAAIPAPLVFSVKIDYANSQIIVEGENLDPGTAVGTIAGVGLTLDGASSSTTLLFPFSPAVSAVVDELGNYVLNISTDGGSFVLSAFIPFALADAPPLPPPGPDCPCSTEWDDKSTTPSPGGFSGLTPYCSQDSTNFVTVQFYDQAIGNYWVLWTEWSGSSGYCELYIDVQSRPLTSQAQFDACASYLRNIVTVWGNQGYDCIL
jgi:hypothetical protein